MNLYLSPDIQAYFDKSQPLFDQVMALKGEIFRSQKGRVTQRVRLGDKTYFIKQHRGVGWLEIVKNILYGRAPVLGARNEWQAIKKLKDVGICVPMVVGYGERGVNPAKRESFVLMEEVAPAMSLEEMSRHWRQAPPAPMLKRGLIKRVAEVARLMHQHGMNHRDFYICHFLLNTTDQASLCLIDLHRAQIRGKTPKRWVIKDLAGLYFSSFDIGLTQRDYLRFMMTYESKSLREIVNTTNAFWQRVKRRGYKLYRDHQ